MVGVAGGKNARDGFWFQDAMTLLRVLTDAIERRTRVAFGEPPGEILVVRVEAAVTTTTNVARPLWDSTYTRGTKVIVDESKKGGPEKAERLDFYRRIRSTVASGVAADAITPRFTVERDSINNDEKWHQLAASALMVSSSKPVGGVFTSDQLAAEALYYLTEHTAFDQTDPKAPPRPQISAIPLGDARSLLARFVLDNTRTTTEIEQELKSALDKIGASWSTDQLVDALSGWINRIARERILDLTVTADTLATEVLLVGRYLQETPETEALWNRLRRATPTLPSSEIAVQPWRDIQPSLANQIISLGDRSVFTAIGGSGKSFVLGQLHNESVGVRVWLDAHITDGIEAALVFGSWACHQRGEPLRIFVDGLDSAASPIKVLAIIDRALSIHPAQVHVATRATTWAAIRDAHPSWTEFLLEPWSESRVRSIADAGRGTPVAADLAELLRTPLLLDLFLRTFKPSEPVPAGLATRHGVLKAYFERRILPSTGQEAVERRRALDRGTEATFINESHWLDASAAAGVLVSEGVFVQAAGEYAFRHALLRDFAASIFLRRSDVANIATRLVGVANPSTRNDLLRALMESRLGLEVGARSETLEDLVVECATQGLPPGIAIGSTDAPTQALIKAIAPLDQGSILRQAITRAHAIDNRAWIFAIASIGGARPQWLEIVQLDALSRLAQFAIDTNDSIACRALAETLRRWTFGEAGDTWAISTILTLVARELRDNDTLTWLGSLNLSNGLDRNDLLDQVRQMLTVSTELDGVNATAALMNLIFGSNRQRALSHHQRSTVVRVLLRREDDRGGLLEVRPEIALPISFELSAVDADEERARRDARDSDPVMREALAAVGRAILRPDREDLTSAQERLRRLPTLSVAEAWGGLTDDMPSEHGRFDEVDQIMAAATRLAIDEATFPIVVSAALRSRSICARMIVLRAAIPNRDELVVSEILCDRRIYHSVHSLPELHSAIARFWERLSPVAKVAIQSNVLEIAQSPILRLVAVGKVASAIPLAGRAPQFLPYIEFLEETGRPTIPGIPFRPPIDDGGVVPAIPADGDADNEPSGPATRAVYQPFLDAARNPSSEDASRTLCDLIDNNQLGAETPTDVCFSASSVVSHDEQAHEQRLVGGPQALTLFARALEQAATNVARSDASLWTSLIDLADACAGHIANQGNRALRERLTTAIADAAGSGVDGSLIPSRCDAGPRSAG